MSPLATTTPTTIGACVTLACIWEATAPKPGNVYRGADFDDLTYVDFLTGAAIVGPVLEKSADTGVGQAVLEAITRTQTAVRTNVNLGIVLLLAPLAAVPTDRTLTAGVGDVLDALNSADAEQVYAAIRLAQPSGLGRADQADVNEAVAPAISLVAAMQLAAERDLVARQYTNQFSEVFRLADLVEQDLQTGLPLSDAIVHVFLQLLAEFPDSLIARKCGNQVAGEVSAQAAAVLAAGKPGHLAYENAVRALDFSLRADGHRRNPGTSADLVAAALFVLLRDRRLDWPVRFYRGVENE